MEVECKEGTLGPKSVLKSVHIKFFSLAPAMFWQRYPPSKVTFRASFVLNVDEEDYASSQ